MTSDERKEWHWLKDARDAIEKIQAHPQFSEGKKRLILMSIIVFGSCSIPERIGECVSNLRAGFNYDERHPDIDWQGTQGMRRRIVHQYWRTDYELVWKGVEYLPKIKNKIDELLKGKADEPDFTPPHQLKLEDILKSKKNKEPEEPDKSKGGDQVDDLNR